MENYSDTELLDFVLTFVLKTNRTELQKLAKEKLCGVNRLLKLEQSKSFKNRSEQNKLCMATYNVNLFKEWDEIQNDLFWIALHTHSISICALQEVKGLRGSEEAPLLIELLKYLNKCEQLSTDIGGCKWASATLAVGTGHGAVEHLSFIYDESHVNLSSEITMHKVGNTKHTRQFVQAKFVTVATGLEIIICNLHASSKKTKQQWFDGFNDRFQQLDSVIANDYVVGDFNLMVDERKLCILFAPHPGYFNIHNNKYSMFESVHDLPTRGDQNYDLFMRNTASNWKAEKCEVVKLSIGDRSLSDHDMVVCTTVYEGNATVENLVGKRVDALVDTPLRPPLRRTNKAETPLTEVTKYNKNSLLGEENWESSGDNDADTPHLFPTANSTKMVGSNKSTTVTNTNTTGSVPLCRLESERRIDYTKKKFTAEKMVELVEFLFGELHGTDSQKRETISREWGGLSMACSGNDLQNYNNLIKNPREAKWKKLLSMIPIAHLDKFFEE